MSTAREQIVDTFADAGELAAQVGLLPEALDELIARLDRDGRLTELTAHRWIKPQALDKPSRPRRRKDGCLFAMPVILAQKLARR